MSSCMRVMYKQTVAANGQERCRTVQRLGDGINAGIGIWRLWTSPRASLPGCTRPRVTSFVRTVIVPRGHRWHLI